MQLLKQLLEAKQSPKNAPVFRATILWFAETEDKLERSLKKFDKYLKNSRIDLLDVNQVDDEDYELNFIGPKDQVVNMLNNIGDIPSFSVMNEDIPNLKTYLDTLGYKKPDYELHLVNCTIQSGLSHITDPHVFIQNCKLGSDKDHVALWKIVFKLMSKKIDEFDFQDQMIQAGFEKYL